MLFCTYAVSGFALAHGPAAAQQAESVYAESRPDIAERWEPISRAEYGQRAVPRYFVEDPLAEFYYREKGLLMLRTFNINQTMESSFDLAGPVIALFHHETGVEPSYYHSLPFVEGGLALVEEYLGKTCDDCETHREKAAFAFDQFDEAQGRLARRYGATLERTDTDARAWLNISAEEAASLSDPDLAYKVAYERFTRTGKAEFDALYSARFGQWIMANADRLRIIDPNGTMASTISLMLPPETAREILQDDPEVLAGLEELLGDPIEESDPLFDSLYTRYINAGQREISRFARLGVHAGPSIDGKSEAMDNLMRAALRIGQANRPVIGKCAPPQDVYAPFYISDTVESEYPVIDPIQLSETFLTWDPQGRANPMLSAMYGLSSGAQPASGMDVIVNEALSDAAQLSYDRQRHFDRFPQLYATAVSDVVNSRVLGMVALGQSDVVAAENGRITREYRVRYSTNGFDGSVAEADNAPTGPVHIGPACEPLTHRYDWHEARKYRVRPQFAYSSQVPLDYENLWSIKIDHQADGSVRRISLRDAAAGVPGMPIRDNLDGGPIAGAFAEVMSDRPYDLEVPFENGLINGTVKVRNAVAYGDGLYATVLRRLAGLSGWVAGKVDGADIEMRNSLLHGTATFYFTGENCGDQVFTREFRNGALVRGSSTYESCSL